MIRISTARPPKRPGSFRDMDWALQQAGWEKQLRRLAADSRPAPRTSRPLRRRVALTLADGFTPKDVLLLAKPAAPFVGPEQDDLACGKCGQTLCEGLSTRALRHRHPEGRRLIVRCGCRALNLVADR